jgi:hypothetical protein
MGDGRCIAGRWRLPGDVTHFPECQPSRVCDEKASSLRKGHDAVPGWLFPFALQVGRISNRRRHCR